ncbi:hypothetical protein WR25_21764 [Diploscapter pachys]|uniref:Uncharacterized protein n=1 Tax=Diploscapter pachys TaxID=2018661 RepID=A0A2A2LFI0_9BILA|nr:hypothetical protein WR25_21764 [Diploscapter pachys]
MNYSILLIVFGLSMAIVEAKMCFGNKTNGGVGEVYCKSKFCMKMTKLEAEDPHPLRESRRKLEQEEVIYGCPQRKGQPGYCSEDGCRENIFMGQTCCCSTEKCNFGVPKSFATSMILTIFIGLFYRFLM